MSKTIEVIITRSKREIGKLGQRKKVKFGYFRNFLFPNGFAIKATEENMDVFKSIEKRELKRLESERAGAKEIQAAVNGKEIRIEASSTDAGKLYGSVTDNDIAESIKNELGATVDPKKLSIKHIKEVGSFSIFVDIHPEVEIKVSVDVFSKEYEAAKAKAAEQEARREAQRAEMEASARAVADEEAAAEDAAIAEAEEGDASAEENNEETVASADSAEATETEDAEPAE